MSLCQFAGRSLSALIIAVSLLLLGRPAAVAQAVPEADYFARFKYTVDEAVDLLKKIDGKTVAEIPEARALLDDLGHWKKVRDGGTFNMTPEFEKQIRAQYAYLARAFSYEAGDLVWVKADAPEMKPYGIADINHRGIIRETQRVDGTDYYVVDVYIDGAAKMAQKDGQFYDGKRGKILYYGDNYSLDKMTRLYTKSELDVINSPGSSLPKDNAGEVLDWASDKLWLEKLEAFKAKMAQNGFEIDWTAKPDAIQSQQAKLMLEIFRHFKMNRNAPSVSGRGIGPRACGGGVCFDQALVLTYAVQGVGQTSGIKAINLSGTTVNPMGGHGFVRIDLKTKSQDVVFDRAVPYEDWNNSYRKSGSVSGKVIYEGLKLKTNSFTGISDPGWFDYGVTPDQFALMPISDALNTKPMDANRAVNGVAPQRGLVEVAEKLGAKGPLAVNSSQALAGLDGNLRQKMIRDYEKAKQQNDPKALQKAVEAGVGASGPTCTILFRGAQ